MGIALVAVGSGLGLAATFRLRTRWPGWAVALTLAVAGIAGGSGALLVQRLVSPADWVVTVAALAALVPFHVRVMLGPLGRLPEPADA